MPPFIPKRRLDDPSPAPSPPPIKKAKVETSVQQKPHERAGLHVGIKAPSSSSSDSSLSEVDSDEFEVVPLSSPMRHGGEDNDEEDADDDDDDGDDDDDDDIAWEDAAATEAMENAPLPTGNISITIDKQDDYINYTASNKTAKKGPSKREKLIRVRTHQLHVQFLLYHNLLRNSWACDKEVQAILVRQLPADILKQVDKWRRASGLVAPNPSKSSKKESRGGKAGNSRNQRDWGQPSSRIEPPHAADMSRGDPLIALLRTLSAYWKSKFAITAPGLRKRGYSTKLELRRLVDSFQRGQHSPELHGERIRDLSEFRERARTCQGSRDVGAQLFTALLRGLGIEARMVASLQPAGYGFTKVEQTAPSKDGTVTPAAISTSEDQPSGHASTTKPGKKHTQSTRGQRPQKGNPVRVNVDTDDESDSDSVVDLTPALPSARRPLYDRELAFPIYWTEAISPITSKPIPCSPLVLQNAVATSDEHLAAFEPRGVKAEASKLVIAYVVGYSSDNTAKDLTVRYLRKHIFPGKAKPFRYPVQSIPVYSSSGRIKRYEDYDWFKSVLAPYTRTQQMRTATDDIEDSTDLVAQEPPQKKKTDDGPDTLSSLKSNPDSVLERHLRREEAIRPGAKPDRIFVSGKEPNLQSEPVYRRSDVERCLTAESWHKEGRRPKPAETPLKLVPVRAVTLTRKREAEEHERITGEKQLQGLYSWDQTEYIIPPPIENGVIPKNSYGNIDAFVPSMVPRGAKHIPLRGTVRICKKLDIDFAEAVVGFEFGNKRAVPVIQGVVVAEENELLVRNAWKEHEEAQRKREEAKMEKLVLGLWRKFLMGLRIRKEVGQVYGGNRHGGDQPFGNNANDISNNTSSMALLKNKGATRDEPIDLDSDPGPDDQPPANDDNDNDNDNDDLAGREAEAGGFLLPDEEDDYLSPEDLVVEEEEEEEPPPPPPSQQQATTTTTPASSSLLGQKKSSSLFEQADNGDGDDRGDFSPISSDPDPDPDLDPDSDQDPDPDPDLASKSTATATATATVVDKDESTISSSTRCHRRRRIGNHETQNSTPTADITNLNKLHPPHPPPPSSSGTVATVATAAATAAATVVTPPSATTSSATTASPLPTEIRRSNRHRSSPAPTVRPAAKTLEKVNGEAPTRRRTGRGQATRGAHKRNMLTSPYFDSSASE